jgi:hypothetical protein
LVLFQDLCTTFRPLLFVCFATRSVRVCPETESKAADESALLTKTTLKIIKRANKPLVTFFTYTFPLVF